MIGCDFDTRKLSPIHEIHTTMKTYTFQDLYPLSKILDLSDAEQKVLSSVASGYAKFVSKIAKESGVPRGSLPYILQNLKRRGLVQSHLSTTPYWGRLESRKQRTLWSAHIQKVALHLQYVARDILSK